MKTTDGVYLTPAEAGERLGVTGRSIYRMVDRGDLEGVYLGQSRSLRIRANDVTLLRPAQAAERLGVSERQVYRLVETGELRHHQVGSKVRIRLSDVIAYAEANTTN